MTCDAPLVSIIVINHNYARFLRDAIDSALAQTYENVEIIVVDDGSTDDSRAILRNYSPPVRLLFRPRGGHVSAVNTGYTACNGNIVFFLDADDALAETALEAVVSAWHPGMAKVQFPLMITDAEKRPLGLVPRMHQALSAEDIARYVRRRGFYPAPPSSGNAYSRDFLDRVMPLDNDTFDRNPDGLLNTIAPLYGAVISLGAPHGFYRIHGDNQWAKSKLSPRRFLAYIAQGQKESVWLKDHCERLGTTIHCRDPLDRSLDFLEWRLVARKLFPHNRLVCHESLLALLWNASGSVHFYEPRRWHRVAMLAWFFATALAPRRLAMRLAQLRFVPSARSKVLSRIVRVLQGTTASPMTFAIAKKPGELTGNVTRRR
jgi:glycosyltransferase involved in cell wall biosynthesis